MDNNLVNRLTTFFQKDLTVFEALIEEQKEDLRKTLALTHDQYIRLELLAGINTLDILKRLPIKLIEEKKQIQKLEEFNY